jgi:hypothetical protein
MDGLNTQFISNPKAILEKYAVVCYLGEDAQKNDINRINNNTLGVSQEFAPRVEFDLVRNKLGYVDLKILGGVGSYGGTTRKGRPIVGNYIPYLGQKDNSPSSANFGRINLSQVTANYVFTFTFTGCNFVVTREGGSVYVYHEPTAAVWTGGVGSRYTGATILHERIGPAYDPMTNSGFGCLVKSTATRWIAYVQTPSGIKMSKDRLSETVIDI